MINRPCDVYLHVFHLYSASRVFHHVNQSIERGFLVNKQFRPMFWWHLQNYFHLNRFSTHKFWQIKLYTVYYGNIASTTQLICVEWKTTGNENKWEEKNMKFIRCNIHTNKVFFWLVCNTLLTLELTSTHYLRRIRSDVLIQKIINFIWCGVKIIIIDKINGKAAFDPNHCNEWTFFPG